jgi:hypothetical protein
MPRDAVEAVALDLGVPEATARTLEVLPPRFERDTWLADVARGLDRRIRLGERLTRLELDEISLGIAERLVLRYKGAQYVLGAGAPPKDREMARLSELLHDEADPGLEAVARLLGRSALEARAATREHRTERGASKPRRPGPTRH